MDSYLIVKAIREHRKIGSGTCSVVDECYTDEDIVRECNTYNIKTVKKAVSHFLDMEKLHNENYNNCKFE